jgi:hypothetical protein
MDTAARHPQRRTASVLIDKHDVGSQAAHALYRPLIAGELRPEALIEAGDGSKAVDYGGHPFRIGLRQGCVGREDGGHRGEVPAAHACVKELEVCRDLCGSAWLRLCGCGVGLGIRPSSTGSKSTDKEHCEESKESEQFRFACVRIHQIFGPFCDWPGIYSSYQILLITIGSD